MTVSETGHFKSKVLKTRYPVDEGLEAGTTRRFDDTSYLEVQEESLIGNKFIGGS